MRPSVADEIARTRHERCELPLKAAASKTCAMTEFSCDAGHKICVTDKEIDAFPMVTKDSR